MATNFPTSLDTLTNPATSDQLNSPSHAAQHANSNDAIEQLEAKVGVNGSAVTTSHDYKIAQLETNLQNTVGDYIPLSELGQPSGAASLDADGNLIVPENKIIIEGATADGHELTLQAPDVASDITVTLPGTTDTLVGRATTDTLTNKSISLANNTVTSTLAQLNTAVTDADVASLAGAETLTNKTLTSPVISGLTLSDSSIVIEGATADDHETTITFVNPTEDRTITFPNNSGTVAFTSDISAAAGGSVSETGTHTLTNKSISLTNNTITGTLAQFNTAVTDADLAPIASPTFTGTPTLPTGTIATTQTPGNNSTAVATTAYADAAVAALVDSAPATLNTLDELATALGDDSSFATTVTTSIGLKAPLASPTFTGTVTIPSGASISGFAPLASPTFTGTVGGITATTVGLGSVNNTSDASKPISTATQTALDLKSALASPTFTGTPSAPTATVGNDSTQIATTAFVIDQIDASTQPGALYQTTAPASPEIGQIWIDSDDNVTVFDSNIIRRQQFTATAGQTSFVTAISFIDGFEQVYFNGLLLLKTIDYTTSGSNTITLISAAAVSDIVEVVTVTNLNSQNTYTQSEINSLLAANTSVAPLSISVNTSLVAKKRYFVTSASALTLTLPASPTLNDEIQILDASGNASTYNITVARNTNLINGNAGNLIIDNNGGWYVLLYTGATYGWKVG